MPVQCSLESVQELPSEWPFVNEFFMVQGAYFRCMAYCDPQGKWHNAINHEELIGDVCILE